MTRCTSCKDALPGGCSACRPMPAAVTCTVGPITYYLSLPLEAASGPVHTCPQCMRGLPCDPSSLSSLVGQIATRKPSEAEWKGREFGGWDANGSPAPSYPGPEVQ